MRTNEYKEELCKKYKPYLELIDKLGNKIMFQQQIIDLSIVLNIAQDKYVVIKALNELVSGEILKKIKFGSKKAQILIFKKYAIRFLRGLSSSQSVGAVPKVNTNTRYWESYFKVQLIIERYIKRMKKLQIDLSLDNLLKFIKDKNSTILLGKNNTVAFYENLMEQEQFTNILDKDVVNQHLKTLKQEYNNMLNNLSNNNEVKEVDDKKKKRKNKWDFLYYSTIGTLTRKNVYITTITLDKKDKKKVNVKCVYLDINNTQNYKNAITNLAITYRIFTKIFKIDDKNINLNFTIITQNKIAQQNMNRHKYKKNDLFESLKISRLYWENIKVRITTLKKELIEVETEDPVQSVKEVIQVEKEKRIVAENKTHEEEKEEVQDQVEVDDKIKVNEEANKEVQKQASVHNKKKHFLSINSLDFFDDF